MTTPTNAPIIVPVHSFKDVFLSGLTTVGNGIKTAAIATKDFAILAGHHIKLGFTDHLVPAIQKLWSGISFAALKMGQFARTPLGIGSALVLFGLATAAASDYFLPVRKDAHGNDMVDKHGDPQREYPLLKFMIDVAAGVIGVAGVAFACYYGGQSGFLTKII